MFVCFQNGGHCHLALSGATRWLTEKHRAPALARTRHSHEAGSISPLPQAPAWETLLVSSPHAVTTARLGRAQPYGDAAQSRVALEAGGGAQRRTQGLGVFRALWPLGWRP